MRNLAIECSGLAASVGIFEDEQLVASREIGRDESTAQMLAPAIEELLGASVSPTARDHSASVDLISVTVGPGSFTGLRVGLATAKMLAMAWDVPLAGVDSLHAIAAAQLSPQVADDRRWLVVAMNAFRRQVFSAVWTVAPDGESEEPNSAAWKNVMEPAVVDAKRWKQNPLEGVSLPNLDQGSIVVTGPALEIYSPDPMPRLQVAEETLWLPKLEAVAQIGAGKYSDGSVCSSGELLPNYVRASAAEEKAASK